MTPVDLNKQRVGEQRAGKSGYSGDRGFSLVELMLVLGILAVVLVVVLPAFSDIRMSTRLRDYSNSMVASVYLARGEAIKRNESVRLCMSSGVSCASTGSWEDGWVVIDPNDVVLFAQTKFDSGYEMTAPDPNSRVLTFNADGFVTGASTFTVCKQTPTAGAHYREVVVAPTGNAKVNRREGTCP